MSAPSPSSMLCLALSLTHSMFTSLHLSPSLSLSYTPLCLPLGAKIARNSKFIAVAAHSATACVSATERERDRKREG